MKVNKPDSQIYFCKKIKLYLSTEKYGFDTGSSVYIVIGKMLTKIFAAKFVRKI